LGIYFAKCSSSNFLTVSLAELQNTAGNMPWIAQQTLAFIKEKEILNDRFKWEK